MSCGEARGYAKAPSIAIFSIWTGHAFWYINGIWTHLLSDRVEKSLEVITICSLTWKNISAWASLWSARVSWTYVLHLLFYPKSYLHESLFSVLSKFLSISSDWLKLWTLWNELQWKITLLAIKNTISWRTILQKNKSYSLRK